MWVGCVKPRRDGIVLFDPETIADHFGESLPMGSNLLERFTASDDGDVALERGLLVPIAQIWGDEFVVIVRLASESHSFITRERIRNGTFPLRVRRELVLGGFDLLTSWGHGEEQHRLPWSAGIYGVDVTGFEVVGRVGGIVPDAGYEFVLTPTDELPRVSGDPGKQMQFM